MSTPTERRNVVQQLARLHVFQTVARNARDRSTHNSTICGMQMTAEIIGITHRQLIAIEDHAVAWTRQNCPGMTTDPPGCQLSCPSACQYVPLPAALWM